MSNINWRITAKESKMFGIHFSAYLAIIALIFPGVRNTPLGTVIWLYLLLIIILSILGNRKGVTVATYIRIIRAKIGRFLFAKAKRYLISDQPLSHLRWRNRI